MSRCDRKQIKAYLAVKTHECTVEIANLTNASADEDLKSNDKACQLQCGVVADIPLIPDR